MYIIIFILSIVHVNADFLCDHGSLASSCIVTTDRLLEVFITLAKLLFLSAYLHIRMNQYCKETY